MAIARLDHALPSPMHGFAVLVGRELAARLGSFWMYLLASGACLIAVLFGAGFQSGFETETVLVSANPLAMLNAFIAVFLAIILGLRLAAGLSWEREHQTLEVLLLAPTGARAVLVSKFAAEFVIMLLILGIYAMFLMLGQPLGAGVVFWQDIVSLVALVPLMLPMLALGLFVACFFVQVRASVIAYLIVIGVLAAFEILSAVLLVSQPQDLSLAQIYLKAGILGAEQVIGMISPVAPLAEMIGSGLAETAFEAGRLVWWGLVSLVTLGISAEHLRVRGSQ